MCVSRVCEDIQVLLRDTSFVRYFVCLWLKEIIFDVYVGETVGFVLIFLDFNKIGGTFVTVAKV